MSSLQELFERDPFEYEEKDLKEIVRFFREKRKQSASVEANLKKRVAKPRRKKKNIIPDLDMTGLGL